MKELEWTCVTYDENQKPVLCSESYTENDMNFVASVQATSLEENIQMLKSHLGDEWGA